MDKVIELECLEDEHGHYIVKEVAIMGTRGAEIATATFLPPSEWRDLPSPTRRQNSWMWRNLHHILWRDGVEPYEALVPFIMKHITTEDHLFTKGARKASFLTLLLERSVYELGELGCPKSKDFHQAVHLCPHPNLSHQHKLSLHCAVKKCQWFAIWVRRNRPPHGYDTVDQQMDFQ